MSVSNPVYNVNVHSKFALFMDDDLCEAEPDDIIKKVQEEKKKKEIASKEAKKQKNQKHTKPEEPIVTKTEEKKVNEKAPRFQNRNRFNQTDKPPMTDEEAEKRKNKRVGNAPPRRFRGREYDRHSGSDKTGIKPVDKRDGSGAHNWGSTKDVIEEAQQPETKDEPEKQSDNEVPVQEVEKKEPEKVTMSLSEWKALNKENTIVASTRARAANNGEDVFSGMNAYKKRNKTLSESDNEIVPVEDDHKGRREIKVNIEFTGRQPRRGGRGGYNANRFNRDNVPKKVENDVPLNLDEKEFPTLQ